MITKLAYRWRPVTERDLSILGELDAACTLIDGPSSVPEPDYAVLLDTPGTALICASTVHESDNSLVAFGWVQVDGSQARIGGKVHPDYRRKRLGSHIIQWAEAQAKSATTFTIRHEAFNEGSAALYAEHGYQCDFVEAWMMRDLHETLPPVTQAFTYIPWTTDNERQFFEVYHDAFKERPGFPNPSAAQWIADSAEDEDFRSDLSLLAVENGVRVGFVSTYVLHLPGQDAPIGWIGQVGTRPAWRGRGAATGLIAAGMHAFKAEGFDAIGLHVNLNNPGAKKVYEQLGFKEVGQRAKYSKS